MQRRVKAYFDDFNTVKAYFDKPFSLSKIKKLCIYNNNQAVDFKIIDLVELEYHYKATIKLAKDINLDDYYKLYVDNRVLNIYYRHITACEAFMDHFPYDIEKLGSFYTKDSTVFNVYSPLASSIRLHLVESNDYYPMTMVKNGIYTIKLEGDFENVEYRYEVDIEDEIKETVDPFSYSSSLNSQSSIVIDINKLSTDNIKPKNRIESPCDAIIEEISIRDMTSCPLSSTKNHSNFLALSEEYTSFNTYPTGLNYLKQLGITHVQIMPVFDFGSVDENNEHEYNWGYDPVQYNVCEGSYIVNKKNPYARVEEFKHLVNTFHKNDIRVILDVVFNHVYHVEEFSLNILCPYMCFRYYDDEYLANGSYCGNEMRTENPFVHDYIVLMIKRYLKYFDIDGLRFDLMGLIDIELIEDIRDLCLKEKPDFIVYGEGWNMGNNLKLEEKACIENSHKLQNVGFFNPLFRDTIKGGSMQHDIFHSGFVLNNLSNRDVVKECLMGSIHRGFNSPVQSINYIECHDNMTFYDKMKLCAKNASYSEYVKRTKLSLAIILLSQGIPFIHIGQEFMRTKFYKDNTYNLSDYYNMVDYNLMIQNYDIVNYYRNLIKLRKSHKVFRLSDSEQINQRVSFIDYYEVLIYKIDDYLVFINPSNYMMYYDLEECYTMLFENGKLVNYDISNELQMDSLSVYVLVKKCS